MISTMQEAFLLLVMLTADFYLLRWLLGWKKSPITSQQIRVQFLERLPHIFPKAVLHASSADTLQLTIQEQECRIHLHQLYRRCIEYPPYTRLFIHQAVDILKSSFQDGPDLPSDWKDQVMPMVYHRLVPDMEHFLQKRFSPSLHYGFVYTYPQCFRWIAEEDMHQAGTSEDEISTLAMRNLDRSCNMLSISQLSVWDDGRDRLLTFHTQDGFDATRVLLPNFYNRFSPRFGNIPLYVAVPGRDLLAIVGAFDIHTELLAWRTRKEFSKRAYPIYDDLLFFDDNGVKERIDINREAAALTQIISQQAAQPEAANPETNEVNNVPKV